MKAAVLRKPQELVVQEVDEPACPPGGALIRVAACAICPTDIKMARVGHRDLAYPRVLGHEVVGVVEALDAEVEGISEGDPVQVWPGVSCGACPSCRRGRDNLCSHQGIIGFNRDGGFAQRMAVPRGTVANNGLQKIPGHLDPAEVALTEPLACCVRAQDASAVSSGDVVLVYGSGPLGLLHIALARHRGATPLAIEPDEDRRALALKFGAEIVVNPSPADVGDAVKWASEGRGADVALLATPQVVIDDALLDRMAPGGRVCAFSGRPKEASRIDVDVNRLHYRELTLVGAYGCTSGSDAEALRLIAEGNVNVKPLISARMPLEDIERGFRMIEERRALKCVITEF
jgi:L-iditol 2-dehydrogenase